MIKQKIKIKEKKIKKKKKKKTYQQHFESKTSNNAHEEKPSQDDPYSQANRQPSK